MTSLSPRPVERPVIAELRARLAAMGGLADLSGPPRPRRQPSIPAPPSPGDRAAALGFSPQGLGPGQALVRRVVVELQPFLERAGAAAPPEPEQLVRLLYSLPADVALRPWRADQLVVLDIETLGLRGSGVVPFLIGLAAFAGSSLEIDQYLLGDPGAEAAMLDGVIAALAGRGLLISYNGRSFDIPVLQSRCVINRRPPEAVTPVIHCDLLAPVRRLFRDRLRACTLRQAELGLLGFDRGEDVPGFEAPGRYRAWLRGAPAAVLEGVVRHNQFDLCATAVLAARLVGHVAGNLVSPVHPTDRYHLGVHLERVGEYDAAEEHLWWAFRDGEPPWSRQAGHHIARRRRRSGSMTAIPVWRELCRRHPGDLAAARGLAIALERTGDLSGAMAVCVDAEAQLASAAGWQRRLAVVSVRRGQLEQEWRRRAERLRRRLRGTDDLLSFGSPP